MEQPTTAVAMGIPVVLTATSRKKVPMALGVMTAGTLVDLHEIPRRDTRKKTGYQREASQARVNRLIKDLRDGRVDLPTSVLLNLRKYEAHLHLSHQNGQKYFDPREQSLYVVDGQHRLAALACLVEENPEKWTDFEIPFGCMLGADEREEMEQFYVVNSTAKSVRTDLALDLLKQRAESNVDVMKSLIERGQNWKVAAQTLVERLSETSAWRDRIRFPLDPKGETTITSAGMVASFRQLLATPYFGSITTENQVKVLDAYWQAMGQVAQDVFSDPSQYVLQKGIGVMAMHSALISVIEYVRSKGKSVIERESYEEPLGEMLLEIEGDNGEGVVRGIDFWRTAPEGAAGAFSSSAGRRVLIAKLRELLPPVEGGVMWRNRLSAGGRRQRAYWVQPSSRLDGRRSRHRSGVYDFAAPSVFVDAQDLFDEGALRHGALEADRLVHNRLGHAHHVIACHEIGELGDLHHISGDQLALDG